MVPIVQGLGPQRLARLILGRDFAHSSVMELLSTELIAGGSVISQLVAGEEAERRSSAVTQAIDGILRGNAERGITNKYVWEDGPGSGRLVNCQIIETSDDARRIDLRDQLVCQFEAGLFSDPRDFELAAGYLLDIYGANSEDRGVTSYHGDKGFDFFGVLRRTLPIGRRRLQGQPWRIVGQAKRYSGSVCSDEIDTFGARLTGVRHNNPQLMSPFSEGFRRNEMAVVGLFVTTGVFQTGALAAAPRHLIVTLDREQVAEDLAASPDSARWCDETGDFIPDRFLGFIRSRQGMVPR